jgi:hypothetical protein
MHNLFSASVDPEHRLSVRITTTIDITSGMAAARITLQSQT